MSTDRAATAAAATIAAIAGVGLLATLDRVEYRERVDEGFYVVYAGLMASEGPGRFPELFRDYVRDESRWRYPNPLRLAYFAAAAPWVAVAEDDFAALSRLSVACHAIAVLAGFLFARRALGAPRALALAALLACSPLWLGLARRALLDGFATLWGVLSLWSFFEAVRRPDRRAGWGLFAGVFTVALLAKETHVLLAPVLAVFAGIERVRRGAPVAPGRVALALGAPCVVAAAVWSAAAGGPGTVLALAGIILASPETNPHANAYGTGSWLRYVVDFLMLSPGPTLLAMAGLGAFALRRRFRDAEPLLVLLALVTVGVLLAFDPFTKNVRYVALLDLPLRAFAVVALWTACGEGRSRAGRVGFGLAVAALCALDLRTFSWMFVQLGLYDPISVDLLTLRGLVPPPR